MIIDKKMSLEKNESKVKKSNKEAISFVEVKNVSDLYPYIEAGKICSSREAPID